MPTHGPQPHRGCRVHPRTFRYVRVRSRTMSLTAAPLPSRLVPSGRSSHAGARVLVAHPNSSYRCLLRTHRAREGFERHCSDTRSGSGLVGNDATEKKALGALAVAARDILVVRKTRLSSSRESEALSNDSARILARAGDSPSARPHLALSVRQEFSWLVCRLTSQIGLSEYYRFEQTTNTNDSPTRRLYGRGNETGVQ